MRIGIDAMGGDHAPREIVRGGLEALPYLNGHELVLVGDRCVIGAEISRWDKPLAGRYSIVHTTEVIGMDEVPVEAVRTRRDSSIVRMAGMAARAPAAAERTRH